MRKGKKKCKLKKRCKVALSIEKPPHNNKIRSEPIKGIAANKLVIP